MFYFEIKAHLLPAKWAKVRHFVTFRGPQFCTFKPCNDTDTAGSSAVKSAGKVLVFSCQIIASIMKLIGLNVLLFGWLVIFGWWFSESDYYFYITNTKNIFNAFIQKVKEQAISLVVKYKCDLLPWARCDGRGKENCKNRTDRFFMKVQLQMESELCAGGLGSIRFP